MWTSETSRVVVGTMTSMSKTMLFEFNLLRAFIGFQGS